MSEQYTHCILLASNYTNGERLGIRFLVNQENYQVVLNMAGDYIKNSAVSIYFLDTSDKEITSIKEKEPFFKNVDLLEGTDPENIKKFKNSIKNQITSIDLALLLITRMPMTFEQVKKAILVVYCEYLYHYDVPPIAEKIKIINGEIKITNFSYSSLVGKNMADTKQTISCKKDMVVLSKFLNFEGGAKLAHKIINIFDTISIASDFNLETTIDNIVAKFEKSKDVSKRNKSILINIDLLQKSNYTSLIKNHECIQYS